MSSILLDCTFDLIVIPQHITLTASLRARLGSVVLMIMFHLCASLPPIGRRAERI